MNLLFVRDSTKISVAPRETSKRNEISLFCARGHFVRHNAAGCKMRNGKNPETALNSIHERR